MWERPVNCLYTISTDVLGIWVIIIRETLPLVEMVTCPHDRCSWDIVDLDGDGGHYPGSSQGRQGWSGLPEGNMPDQISP